MLPLMRAARPAVRRAGARHINLAAMRKRIEATEAVQKISASMKLVASAKMRGDVQRLEEGRDFAKRLTSTYAGSDAEDDEELDTVPELEFVGDSEDGKKILVVALSTDRGLCGGVNSAVARFVRDDANRLRRAGNKVALLVVGDKGRSQLTRVFSNVMDSVLDQAWSTPLNFATVAGMAEHLAVQDCDTVRIVYNQFVSAIKYDTVVQNVPKFVTYEGIDVDTEAAEDEKLDGMSHLVPYEMAPEGKDGMLSLFEWSLATTLHGALLHTIASEQSSRMTAMENASTNAAELVDSLTLQYNRTRQAKITTELTEIISGAEAVAAS